MSKIEKYHNSINDELNKIYSIANQAKSKGCDPKTNVEIPIAQDISQRVEGLISVISPQVLNSGIAQEIGKLEKKYGKLDWRVGLSIASQVAKEKFCKFKDIKEAMEIGVRIGFAYITLGVVAAPLEGFLEFEIKKRRDEKQYLAMSFAGPIRAAGGTAGAVCVLIGDHVRKEMGFKSYDPDDKEIKRFHTELSDYNSRCVKLQYMPSLEETEMLIKNLPVEITGNATEKFEVSNHKDLTRIPTNVIRGGMCLVLGECIIQKAAKLNKRINEWGMEFNLNEWSFLNDFLSLQKKVKSKNEDKANSIKDSKKILPNYKFIEEVVGGRPVFTFPMEKGGFRLRYGRNRTSGFASTSISSETFEILQDFLAVGTQLRIERPGKSTIITPADNLEPPIVKLKSGNIIKVTKENISKIKNKISEIIHLGDILISHGEFSENNHRLIPNGYCEEQWTIELVDKINKK